MYTIAKTFRFEAAHSLKCVPPGHKCARLHGHSYRAELIFASADLNRGMVRDYSNLTEAEDLIKTRLDHQNLNTVLGPIDTTAEQLANWLYHHLAPTPYPDLSAVRIYETASTWAEYRP